MIFAKNLILAIVATNLPACVLSMQTPNGYLCNLCHSLQNDHPFPPPNAQQVVVRFSKSETEQFGLPWERGITCLEIWDTVLDFANPNVYDQESCRAMAAAYAPQCCNDINEDPRDNLMERQKGGQQQQQQQQQIKEKEEALVSIELDVEESTVVEMVSSDSIDGEDQSSTKRISSSSKRIDINNGKNRRTAVISHLRGRK